MLQSLVTRIKKKPFVYQSIDDIRTAASLAHLGLLRSNKMWMFQDMDLNSVPADHLASLVSCVTNRVVMLNVSNTGSDLVSFLDSVKSRELVIGSQSLSSEESRALVRALESRVEWVVLASGGDLYLDITALTEYTGRGECREVWCYQASADRYGRKMRNWAKRLNWAFNNKDKDPQGHVMIKLKNWF